MSEKAAIMRANSKDQSKLQQLEISIQQRHKKIESMKAEHEVDISKLRKKYERLASQLQEYHATLIEVMSAK